VALDEPTLAYLAKMAALQPPDATPMWQSDVQQVRSGLAARRLSADPFPAMARTEEFTLGSGHEEFRLRLHVPTEAPVGLMVYFHGGGWTIGDIDGNDRLGRELAAASDHAVLLVEYRKSPEYPFPAALNDAWAATGWAARNRERVLGGDGPLVLAGDSAGANLATVTARRATAEGSPHIDVQMLVYPVTDSDLSRPSYLEPENQTLLSLPLIDWFWQNYLPDAEARSAPEASPLRAETLTGMPPTVLITAEHDVLRNEGEAYAARLMSAGVPVISRTVPGQMHGFMSMIDELPASRHTIDFLAATIKRLEEEGTGR